MLVETLLARREGHERKPEGEEEEYRRTAGERARRWLRKCEYYRGMEESREEKEDERKKKSEGESFTPRMTRRKFARERSALATRFIMRSRKRVHVYTYTEHDFVNPALNRSYYAINFNSRL